MAAHDRIRLTGRLRKAPAQAGAFYFPSGTDATERHRRLTKAFTFGVTGPLMGFTMPGLGEKADTRGPMASATSKKKRAAGDAYCPHCHLLIEKRVGDDWPDEPQRCPHCRLLVGAGRARPTPAAEPGARGSAAGVFAHEAKRARGDASASKPEVCKAIRDVAEAVGSRPERLLMVDYQQRASDDESLPALSDVFAAYGSWKRARRAAANAA